VSDDKKDGVHTVSTTDYFCYKKLFVYLLCQSGRGCGAGILRIDRAATVAFFYCKLILKAKSQLEESKIHAIVVSDVSIMQFFLKNFYKKFGNLQLIYIFEFI